MVLTVAELNDNFDVRRLQLQAGDAVVLETDKVLSVNQARVVALLVGKHLADAGHAGVPVIVLDGGMHMKLAIAAPAGLGGADVA